MSDEWTKIMNRELDIKLSKAENAAWQEFSEQHTSALVKAMEVYSDYHERKARVQGMVALSLQAMWMYCVASIIVTITIPMVGPFLGIVTAAIATAFVGYVFDHTGTILSQKLYRVLLTKIEEKAKAPVPPPDEPPTEESKQDDG